MHFSAPGWQWQFEQLIDLRVHLSVKFTLRERASVLNNETT